ncbi:MAG TPA: PepSY domain-containing protein [Gemmatimonadales bacterium]|nr:PepSY domain-containing protein [Gemmatimonadales bacterium]
MLRLLFWAAALAGWLSGAAPLAAQADHPKVKEERSGLLALAHIAPDSAIRLARSRVPHATIQSAEIERENGRLIYSFELKTPGKAGIDEVNVDAMTGYVLPVEHEGPGNR